MRFVGLWNLVFVGAYRQECRYEEFSYVLGAVSVAIAARGLPMPNIIITGEFNLLNIKLSDGTGRSIFKSAAEKRQALGFCGKALSHACCRKSNQR